MSQSNQTITLPRKEYNQLREVASRFEMMRNPFDLGFFTPPPTRDSTLVIQEMKKTGIHTKAFLKSLERGLKASSYFRTSSTR